MKFVIGVALVGIISLAAAGLTVYSGTISVAADEPHSVAVHRFLETVRARSIAARSRDIRVPDLDDQKLIAQGADHYASMCSGCHLAPGVASSELREGLYPRPPNLAEHAHSSAAETFWIIKHGIKMTGMPAWGRSHSDDAIWGLVAFLQKLPHMTESDYRQATAVASHHHAAEAKNVPHGHSHQTAHTHQHDGRN